MSRELRGSTSENTRPRPSIAESQTEVSVESQTVYEGQRDPAAAVGEEYTVTVDRGPLDHRLDLLCASPSGSEWGYSGSGPAQLSVAILAHAYDDEFAYENYQLLKDIIISKLSEKKWTLTKADLDEWQEVCIE